MAKHYAPNHIPQKERLKCLFFSIGLMVYGTIGVLIDDIYIPGKRSRGLHFHGVPCWLMYVALLLAAVNFLSVVIDHYDQRDNEINYHRFAKVTRIAGWIFFALALILDILVFHQATK